MSISNADLREKYLDYFRELQWKNLNDAEKLAVLMILSAYFTELFSARNEPALKIFAPFITEISEPQNTKSVMRGIEDGLKDQGPYARGLKDFIRINRDAITIVGRTIPQPHFEEIKEPKIQTIVETLDRTNLIESSNRASVFVNRMFLKREKKIWNTMRDAKVRQTTFHTGIDFKTADIDGLFMNNGMFAYCPADSVLPLWERLNCRCYLTFR